VNSSDVACSNRGCGSNSTRVVQFCASVAGTGAFSRLPGCAGAGIPRCVRGRLEYHHHRSFRAPGRGRSVGAEHRGLPGRV